MVELSCIAFIRFLVTAVVVSIYMIAINCNGCNDMRLNFVRLTDCQGQAGDNFIIKTLKNVEGVECAKICYETNQCKLFFYNSMTRSCSVHNRTLTDIEMTPQNGSACYLHDNVAESWITEIVSVSSAKSWAPATNMIGPPDSRYWRQATEGRADVVEVRFSSEMYIESIQIYEMYAAGGVSGISLLTPDGTWYSVWSTDQLEAVQVLYTGRIFSPDIEITNFKTSTVRINIGARSGDYEVINAIRVTGISK